MCGVCGCSGEVDSDSLGIHLHEDSDIGKTQLIEIEKSLLGKNQGFADNNRQYFEQNDILALNVLSSPGSGKTTLLVRSIAELGRSNDFYVIEGDQQTSVDADRIRKAGAPAVQINTGKGCHLDAHMIDHACKDLSPSLNSILFIENVGNLVCPADFDLGEFSRVVVLSVTEGEDKPLKYPNIFYTADVVLLNKCDLIPYLDFDAEACEANIRSVNPRAQILYISAKTGEGLAEWYLWLETQIRRLKTKRSELCV